ncbi:MAG: SgcJ/EcaC family oxidoreductase [Candidatus Saccharibacteria bacterium]|nr:SgcJ/EcaC family oxidoreductase [Candidatus Saccharibacteria bacterium]
MDNVSIGNGSFRGKGVQANRDFKKDEVVVPYELTEITKADFKLLPKSQHAYVHSFWGKRFLFRGPSRYVNHAEDKANTYQDLERMADVAARTIKKGEPITTNGDAEVHNELTTLLQAYEKAVNSRDFENVAPMIAKDAVFWFTNGTYHGIKSIRQAFESIYQNIQDGIYKINNIVWLARDYDTAACVYDFTLDGKVNNKQPVYTGRGTNVLQRIDGNWQIIHEHLSSG